MAIACPVSSMLSSSEDSLLSCSSTGRINLGTCNFTAFRKPNRVFVVWRIQASSGMNSTLDHHSPSSFSSVLDVRQKASSIFDQETHFFVTADTIKLPEWTRMSGLLLKAEEDCYEGVIIDPACLPRDSEQFIKSLRASICHWKTQRKRGVWLQLSPELADFVPLAIKEGFQYHHAEQTHVMLTYWIPETPCTLPPNASHQVGIGAFVMNQNREVLAVQEKDGPLRGLGVWKMPTGLIDQGEDLCVGAVREVKEETGVDTEFLQVVGFRHGHFVSFSKSDLYFLCTLRPLSFDVVTQRGEIEAARWMSLEEFKSQPFYSAHKTRRNMLDLCVASWDGHYNGFTAQQLQSSSLARPTQYFFHLQRD
ncbi:hypothetical protein KP509_06G066300 [Ceratopteris richardii]|uniref:Nudix hydrolase domain-containing protein n=1 Tax=Ceratopteris richardii TaxID=49495 RepID=A0A8T2UL56_CERRI|nr:hypothetical protein KP509_06G066300 [Ceratopteris richardii]